MEDDSLLEGEEVAETGHVDEDGVLKRPWCPATRILEHRETEAMNREAEEKRRSAQSAKFGDNPAAQPLREDFPDVPVSCSNALRPWAGEGYMSNAATALSVFVSEKSGRPSRGL